MSDETKICPKCNEATTCDLHFAALMLLEGAKALIEYLDPRLETIVELEDAEGQQKLFEAMGRARLGMSMVKGGDLERVICSKCGKLFEYEENGTAEGMPPGYILTEGEEIIWVCMPCATAKGGK